MRSPFYFIDNADFTDWANVLFLVFFEMFSSQINLIYIAHKFASKGFTICATYDALHPVDPRFGLRKKKEEQQSRDPSSRPDRHAVDFMCID